MASIKIYKCTHRQCLFKVHLSEGMPQWHPDTPNHLKKLPIQGESQIYVVGYRSEAFCRYCRKVVESNPNLICPRCTRSGMYTSEGGRSCPQCLKGQLALEHQSIM